MISDLRKTTKLSVGEIAKSLKAGEILKTYELFGNDQEEVEYELLRLIHEVKRAGAGVKFYEFLYNEEIDLDDLDSYEINEEVLRNMLNNWHKTSNCPETEELENAKDEYMN